MKTRLTMRAALVLGLPGVALGIGRFRRWRGNLWNQAGDEADKGDLLSAGLLVAICLAAL